jgi:hypothetical protein
MRNTIKVLVILLALVGCKKSSNEIEDAIVSIYGINVTPQKTQDGLVYKLFYSNDIGSQSKDFFKLKDKFDTITNSLPKISLDDLVDTTAQTVSDTRDWETPKARILLMKTIGGEKSDICNITVIYTKK